MFNKPEKCYNLQKNTFHLLWSSVEQIVTTGETHIPERDSFELNQGRVISVIHIRQRQTVLLLHIVHNESV